VSAANPWSFEQGVPESATLSARLGAFVVDLVLTSVVTLIFAASLVGAGLIPAPDPSESALDAAASPFVLFVALMEAPIDLAYFTLSEAAWGRTVGKVAFRIRVLSAATGSRPTLGQAAMRNLLRFLWLVPFLSVAFLAIDWYLMRVGEMDQRIGDLAARTFVVKDGVYWPPQAAAPA